MSEVKKEFMLDLFTNKFIAIENTNWHIECKEDMQNEIKK